MIIAAAFLIGFNIGASYEHRQWLKEIDRRVGHRGISINYGMRKGGVNECPPMPRPGSPKGGMRRD